MSFDRLCEKILACKNPTVAGLDPKLDYIPDWIKEESFQRYGRTLPAPPTPIWPSTRG